MLFELGKFIVGDIDEWAFDALGASWQEADDAGEIHFRFSFTDASNDVGAVLGEVFVQERDGECIELASRADGPSGTARVSDLERTRIGFPERCHGLLQALRFSDLGRFETAAGLIMHRELGAPKTYLPARQRPPVRSRHFVRPSYGYVVRTRPIVYGVRTSPPLYRGGRTVHVQSRAGRAVDIEENMMELFEPIDDDTPIEEYPGFVGSTWDGRFYPAPELKVLESFDWLAYQELLEDYGRPRRLVLRGLPQPIECEIEPDDDLAYLLDQIPSLQVKVDKGPPDGGPASGSGYNFNIADEVSYEQFAREMASLRDALDTDLRELRSASPGHAMDHRRR
jgi:hypothetical protein